MHRCMRIVMGDRQVQRELTLLILIVKVMLSV